MTDISKALTDLWPLLADLIWPLLMLAAWALGELVYRYAHLPRICSYVVVGFLAAPAQLGLLPAVMPEVFFYAANVAFGLILFEFGYRINLRWFITNPWLLLVSVLECLASFAAVFFMARFSGVSDQLALLLGSLAIATSPAAVMRVINEERSAGQITERLVHMAGFNCVVSVLVFKLTLGFVVFDNSGNLMQAVYASSVGVAVSALLGVLAGVLLPSLLRGLRRATQDGTLAFALGVILLVSLTHALKLSPIVAALAFGLAARHRRIVVSRSERGFGALGELLSLLLFLFVASRLDWQMVRSGMQLGLLLILARGVAKVLSITALARVSGLTKRKGLLTGLSMMPLSVFAILMLEQIRHLGLNLLDQLAPLAAAIFILELLGPVITQRALRFGGETPRRGGA